LLPTVDLRLFQNTDTARAADRLSRASRAPSDEP